MDSAQLERKGQNPSQKPSERLRTSPVELGRVVRPLGAQVVDLVVILVRRVEVAHDLGHRVPIDAFGSLGGEAHGNDAVRNV